MIKLLYKGWLAFRFKGKQFLALTAKDGNVHIFDASFGNYGSWFSVDSFKKHYAKDGETLNLDKPTGEGVQQ
jgi:hypothetical protein